MVADSEIPRVEGKVPVVIGHSNTGFVMGFITPAELEKVNKILTSSASANDRDKQLDTLFASATSRHIVSFPMTLVPNLPKGTVIDDSVFVTARGVLRKADTPTTGELAKNR